MGPKKKLTRAERNRLEMERLERARIQAELEAQRAIEEERKRLALEKKLAKEKEKKETAEQSLRVEQLTTSNSFIKNMLDYSWNLDCKERDAIKWEQFLKCDGLPTPTDTGQMNTYLHLWQKVSEDVSVEEARRRTKEIIGLLQVLEEFIDDPFDATNTLIDNWKWIRGLCRDQQQENLDMATYKLLRDINKRMNRIDIPTADFTIIDENFILCLRLNVKLATPMHNPRAPAKKRLEINFPETRLNILFPAMLDPKGIVIRAMYLKYDHFSDNCDTYHKPDMTDEFDKDLLECTSQEWYTKMKYKWDNRRRRSKKNGNGSLDEEVLDDEAYSYKEGDIPPPVPYRKLEPSASQYAMNQEGVKTKLSPSKPKLESVDGDGQVVPKTSTIVIVEDNVQDAGGEGQADPTIAEPKEIVAKHKKGKAKKSYSALLTDEPMKFKNISFENALTAEEKAAKKAAKKKEKEAKKGEGEEKDVKTSKSASKEGITLEEPKEGAVSKEKLQSREKMVSKEKIASRDKLASKEKVNFKEKFEGEVEKTPPPSAPAGQESVTDEKKKKTKGGGKKGKKKGESAATSETELIVKFEAPEEKEVGEKSEFDLVGEIKEKSKKKKKKSKEGKRSEDELEAKTKKSSETDLDVTPKTKKKKHPSKAPLKLKASVSTLDSGDVPSVQSDDSKSKKEQASAL
ncbi:Cancer susceptibility candidate 1 N-terminus [Popillia japonica]|uniref:Cancer susceptibility candidate 1 N-terminus n=1 Tax=Popillia japonica TaxID=7064 RepID=A0AAW1N6T3_POPJA